MGRPISSTFSASRGYLHSVAHGPFLFPSSLSFLTSPTLTQTLSIRLIRKDSCDYFGSSQIIKHNISICKFLITSAKFPFPCKVTYSQIRGVRVCTYWGAIILSTSVYLFCPKIYLFSPRSWWVFSFLYAINCMIISIIICVHFPPLMIFVHRVGVHYLFTQLPSFPASFGENNSCFY